MADIFQKGETCPLEIEIRDKDTGALSTPATSVTVTVTDSTGTVKVNNQAMAVKSTGIYYYNLQLATDDESGTWTARFKATDDTKVSITDFTFQVED